MIGFNQIKKRDITVTYKERWGKNKSMPELIFDFCLNADVAH